MLTLQFVPYSDIEKLDSDARIAKLLGIVKDSKVVLLQGRLTAVEESRLIEQTMEQIRDAFRGVEICTILPAERNIEPMARFKKEMFRMLMGNRDGITIIGPSTIIKDIKRDPNKILLYMHDAPQFSAGKQRRKQASKRRTKSAGRRR